MRISPQLFALLMTALLLSACGFHLRGQVFIPFETIYLQAANPNTPFINELRRNIEARQVKLVNASDKAELVLDIVSEISEKQVLSLGGDGRVNEFRLFYRVSLRAYDQQQDWIPAEEIALRSDYSYDDTKVLAKDAEETLLYQSMRSDMVQQIMRRLSRAKLQIN
ncbi:MAG: LPS assembly lipoprotein LptE [Pseudomonadota bacterium]